MAAVMPEGGVRRLKGDYKHNTARDSLSPTGFYSFRRDGVDKSAAVDAQQKDEVELQKSPSGRHAEQPCPSPTSREFEFKMGLTTTPSSAMAGQTCLPRSSAVRGHRPFKLELDDSRGATSVSTAELRRLIKKTAPGPLALSSRVQIIHHTSLPSPFPYKGRKKYPRPGTLIGTTVLVRQTNALPFKPWETRNAVMGNQHSHAANHGHLHGLAAISSSSVGEESSLESITHPRLRNKNPTKRGSMHVLKKKAAAKAGLGANFTSTVIEVPRAATAPNLDLIEDNEQQWEDEEENRKIRHVKTLSAPSPVLLSPGSPATITEESAARPLSAGTTVTGVSLRSDDELPSPVHLRVSALSPTIPTPSPLPEDSPHQYGLKDFADTPSPPPDPKKAKRHSSGIDIFNVCTHLSSSVPALTREQEAKNLQSAASFLNGLSNARRRAESRARSTRSTTKTRLTSASASDLPYKNGSATFQCTSGYRSMSHLPLSEPPSPTSTESRPLTPKLDDLSRTLGHTHKSSGFAYAKPLSIIQLKCYRDHDRLMRSGNKLYQVECAVCHTDAQDDFYWSCTWCAVRMCENCRTAFRKNGVKALKDKIRTAEFGAQA
ncbi:hypothetical protein AMS68_003374 [Peltaster fructicola]|uniref:Uncharacterized protein n=1 Tax=Peltaster fructicola TaxID=286661 RepID=A0A6H0XSW7_9PEZI|nr:hypothetical protein AMS68_003374 [Peltaster fructicola]